MHLASGHHVYELTDNVHPAVASTGCPAVRPSDRPTSTMRCRSDSNPARSMDSHESHFPSGEKRGVLSAPLPVVSACDPPPSDPITYTSTLVLSATVESP